MVAKYLHDDSAPFGVKIWTVSSDICRQRRLRSACASAQSDQGFRCPLTESLDTIEYIDVVKCLDETLRMRGMNLNLCILRMVEYTFSACRSPFDRKENSTTCTVYHLYLTSFKIRKGHFSHYLFLICPFGATNVCFFQSGD